MHDKFILSGWSGFVEVRSFGCICKQDLTKSLSAYNGKMVACETETESADATKKINNSIQICSEL